MKLRIMNNIMLKNLSYDEISHILSFLNINDLENINNVSKEMEMIIKRYRLRERAYKELMLQWFPRIDEALKYKESKDFRNDWIKIYENKSNSDFLKHAFYKSLLYQCDTIMTSKPLVMGIYNLTFELSTKNSRNSELSEWVYRTSAEMIHTKVCEMRKRLIKYGMSNYQREKFQFKVMVDWIEKSTGYIIRYLIPNNGYPSLYEIGETVFNKNIIFYFGLSDIYERNNVKLSALKNTELSHVIWSYIDNN